MLTFEINKPFPGPVPQQEGCFMELWEDGLVALIQMPGLSKQEIQAFEKSFKEYSYLETTTPVPIAVWVFNFPNPHGPVDCNFNSRIVNPEYIDNYLELETGQVKNALVFYLLDQQILKGIKLVGLDPKAVNLFQETIRKQAATEYPQSDYDRYLAGAYRYSTDELFRMGKQFKMGGE